MPQPPLQLELTADCERSDILLCMSRASTAARWYCGSSDCNVYVLDLTSEQPQPEVLKGHRSFVSGAVCPGESTLVTCGWDRELIWWDLATSQAFRRIRAHEKWIRTVSASPDGTCLASVSDDMRCRLWDVKTGELRHELRGHAPRTPHHFPSMLYTCAFSPDGIWLATADKVGQVCVWEVATGKRMATLESAEHYTWDPVQRRHSTGGIRSIRFSPQADLLAVGGVGHIQNIDGLGGKALVHVYDWRTGQRTHVFEHEEQKGLVEDLHYARDGAYLVGAGGGKKGFLLLMDLECETFVQDVSAPMHIHQFEVDNDLQRIAAVGHQRSALWQAA